MQIAIEKGLGDIKNELEKRGYTVFFIGENKIADVVLYKELDSYPFYEVNNVQSVSSASSKDNIAFGALLVNVTNKSLDEILNIINRRTYSPLF